jgi:hypothetical protein
MNDSTLIALRSLCGAFQEASRFGNFSADV